MKKNARVIAFYLPQFHPIPENDKWWGKGFTEWTNVGKAKKLYREHNQPRVPADLGYYDLRLPETLVAQSEMARHAGVEGFAYWHYWWAGKQLLEKPFQAMLDNPKATLPFCLAWANESWSGIWHGKPKHLLMEQTYPGIEDHTKHFYSILPALKDERYIRVENKPLFLLYRPLEMPHVKEYLNHWNELAKKEGLPGIYFVGINHALQKELREIQALGFDGVNTYRLSEACRKISGRYLYAIKLRMLEKVGGLKLNRYEYSKVMQNMFTQEDAQKNIFPTVMPQWDNSPRSGRRGLILHGANPEKFGNHLDKALSLVKGRPEEKRIVFLKSWNEWAEGNYVEPDQEFGWQYLDTLRKKILGLDPIG